MMRPHPVPSSFFIGAKVCRSIQGKWYTGTVVDTRVDEGETLWHIVYPDFDTEDLNKEELTDSLVYHPSLGKAREVQLPEPGQLVCFIRDQAPCVGSVQSVDHTLPRPITVRVYTALRSGRAFVKQQFAPAVSVEDEKPLMQQLAAHQVMLHLQPLSARGFLSVRDRRRLTKHLTQ